MKRLPVLRYKFSMAFDTAFCPDIKTKMAKLKYSFHNESQRGYSTAYFMSSMEWVKRCYSEKLKILINYWFLRPYSHNLVKMQIL